MATQLSICCHLSANGPITSGVSDLSPDRAILAGFLHDIGVFSVLAHADKCCRDENDMAKIWMPAPN